MLFRFKSFSFSAFTFHYFIQSSSRQSQYVHESSTHDSTAPVQPQDLPDQMFCHISADRSHGIVLLFDAGEFIDRLLIAGSISRGMTIMSLFRDILYISVRCFIIKNKFRHMDP